MAVITLTSDMGTRDHYVAGMKAILISELGNVPIVDISHDIQKFNIASASFILNAVYRDFPEGSIHIVSLNNHDYIEEEAPFVLVEIDGHFFVGPNNGLFSLLSDQVSNAVALKSDMVTSPEKEVLVPAAIALTRGLELTEIGEPIEKINRMLHRTVKKTADQLIGAVIYVDDYGNLVTNIQYKHFENFDDDRKFYVEFGRERITEISLTYGTAKSGGDCVVLFNDAGFLEIAINRGRAAELLGLRYDSPVVVSFR